MTTPSVQVPLAAFVRGFDGAYGRLQRALADGEASADDAFPPLFEALNWAVALVDLVRSTGAVIAIDVDDLHGLRFARARAHHQWATALETQDILLPPPVITAGGAGRRGGGATIIRPVSAKGLGLDRCGSAVSAGS
jgi:hypothetical protein